jgi:hypothetical protein
MMLIVGHSSILSTIPAESRFVHMADALSTSQGDDGRRVADSLRNVLSHWFDRATCLVDTTAIEGTEFHPIQLRSVGAIRVRYRPGVRLRLSPYKFDDE